jgi:hypothetical protein
VLDAGDKESIWLCKSILHARCHLLTSAQIAGGHPKTRLLKWEWELPTVNSVFASPSVSLCIDKLSHRSPVVLQIDVDSGRWLIPSTPTKTAQSPRLVNQTSDGGVENRCTSDGSCTLANFELISNRDAGI